MCWLFFITFLIWVMLAFISKQVYLYGFWVTASFCCTLYFYFLQVRTKLEHGYIQNPIFVWEDAHLMRNKLCSFSILYEYVLYSLNVCWITEIQMYLHSLCCYYGSYHNSSSPVASWDIKVSIRCTLQNVSYSTWSSVYFSPTVLWKQW